MYVPPYFAETDLGKLHDFIERHNFALIVSQIEGQPFATHLPFLLERDSGKFGTLVAHFARANPHWREIENQTSLVVFSGPHAYISPTWYEAEQVVPTWNYVAVHATGRAAVLDDEPTLRDIVEKLVEQHEQHMPVPWTLAPGPFVEERLAQIVGVRIEIEKLEGKWKLNQNHPPERRQRVVRRLRERGGDEALEMAEMMQSRLGG